MGKIGRIEKALSIFSAEDELSIKYTNYNKKRKIPI